MKITGIQYYEQRMLYLLRELENPSATVVFVTSMRVEEPIVDYYLRWLSDPRSAADRLYFIALWDMEPRALTEKVLDRPDVLDRLRSFAESGARLITFNNTAYEKRLSEEIGAALSGPDPGLAHLGSKTGSRRIAREARVAVADGKEDLASIAELERALFDLADRRPEAGAAVIKLNHGFSGQGNAIVDLHARGPSLKESTITFCASEETWETYSAKIVEQGAVVEELIRVEGAASPSVQLTIDEEGRPSVVSTHDQVLGGPDNQVYLGCRFPARDPYRRSICDAALRVAGILADKGVRGNFGIDFVVVPHDDGSFEPYLSEINLRLGGTTHPFAMTKMVAKATYEDETGELVASATGRPIAYVASDNLKSQSLIGLEPQQAIDAIDRAGLAFDPRSGLGVTLHLLGALKRWGKMGLTCAAATRPESDDLYEEATRAIEAAL